MNATQQSRIEKHGEQLLAIFPNATERDPVKLCKKLRRHELAAAQITLRLCNGPDYADKGEPGQLLAAILGKVNALLGNTGEDYTEAVRKYRADEYSMKVPPVCTAKWDEPAWIAHIFGVYPPVPVFVNRDPRGYALKIDDGWMRSDYATEIGALGLHRDWGGYGIIAPEIDGKD